MSESKRMTWLDVARGLAMLFVIYGHVANELAVAGVAQDSVFACVMTFINPVKVPMFFAISGYLFRVPEGGAWTFAGRMLKSRLFPYFVWASFMGILAFLMDFYRNAFDSSRVGELLLENYILPLLLGNLIWFIPCLIVTEVLFYIICRIAKDKLWLILILSVFCTTLGYALSADGVVKFWKFDTALTCIQFMCFGMLLRRWETQLEHAKLTRRMDVAMAVYLFLLYCFRGIFGDVRVDVNMGSYFHPLAYTLVSIVGIYAFFAFAKLLARSRSLTFVGQNTFLYFVWHMYMAKVIVFAVRPALKLGIGMSLMALVVTILAGLLVVPVCLLVNRYAPWLVGRRRKMVSAKGEHCYD